MELEVSWWRCPPCWRLTGAIRLCQRQDHPSPGSGFLLCGASGIHLHLGTVGGGLNRAPAMALWALYCPF